MIHHNQLNLILKKLKEIRSAAQLIGLKVSAEGNSKAFPLQISCIPTTDFQKNFSNETYFTDSFIRVSYKILTEQIDVSLIAVTTEIENNLFSIASKENRIIYAKSIIRKFSNIYPYFDIYNQIDINSLYIKSDSKEIYKVHDFLKSYNNDTIEHKNAGYSFAEQYIVKCYKLLKEFSESLQIILYSFEISLDAIQNDLKIYLKRKSDPRLLQYLGFSDETPLHQANPNTHTQDYSSKAAVDPVEIIGRAFIIKLRGIFDGCIWEKENDLQDDDFLKYWKPGPKLKYLPIKKNCINSFLYLYFWYCNKSPDKYDKFKIPHKLSEEVFNIKAIKTKKSKVKTNSPGAIYIRKKLGQPPFNP